MKNNKEIVEDLIKSMKPIYEYISNDIKYIKMDNNEIRVLTYLDIVDKKKILFNIPRRNIKRLLKQGYIICIN